MDRPRCRNCEKNLAIHGKRGLCIRCHSDPYIRPLYPRLPTGRSAKQIACLNQESTADMTLEELEAFIERQRDTMPQDNHPHDVMRPR